MRSEKPINHFGTEGVTLKIGKVSSISPDVVATLLGDRAKPLGIAAIFQYKILPPFQNDQYVSAALSKNHDVRILLVI